MNSLNIAIIGAGPAGIAAGIQLKRYGLDPVIFEKFKVGGLLLNANLIENYLGFPGGITGRGLIDIICKQAKEHCLDIRCEEVLNLDYTDNGFSINTSRDIYDSDIVVIGSGTKPVLFDRVNIPDELKERVLYEIESIIDDESRTIAIIGSGDAAFDYALNLGRKNKVLILNRSKTAGCLPLLYQRVVTNDNIIYFGNAVLKGVKMLNDSRMIIITSISGRSVAYDVDYLVFAIGRIPQTGFISENIVISYEKYINEGRLYFIGDVKNGLSRQCAIAAGDGIKAAMAIYNKLKDNN